MSLAAVSGGNADDPVPTGATDYASIQSTCPSTSSGESGRSISSRRPCRTRLHPPSRRFGATCPLRFSVIVRRGFGGTVQSRFSRSHFQRCPSQEHGRRHGGGVCQVAVSRRRIARFGDAGNPGQEVVVTVGRQAGPRPSSRVPGTVVNHRGGESRRRFRRRNRRKSEMVGVRRFELPTSCSRSKRAPEHASDGGLC